MNKITRSFGKFIYLFAVLMIVFTAVSGCSSVQTKKAQRTAPSYKDLDTEYDSKIKSSAEWQLAAENEKLALYIKGKTAEVKVTDKTTQKEWFTNPDAGDAFVQRSERTSSQMNIEYNINDSPQTYNSWDDAVENEQVTYQKTDNGIRVNYLFGAKPVRYLVPQVLNVERYESFVSKMDEEHRENIETYYQFYSLNGLDKTNQAYFETMYPALREKDAYIVMITTAAGDPNRVYASEYLLTMLHDAFASVGYTEEDFQKDNTENMITEQREPDLSVMASLEYTLGDGDFSVTVPNGSIFYNEEYIKLTKLSVLPMFGAADETKEGYIFVPDGSGAIIRLNNQKVNMPTFTKKLYGNDNTLPLNAADMSDVSLMHMPVFGIKTNAGAFLAVIEKGDAIAEIIADTGGKISRYNTVFPTFNVKCSSEASATSLGVTMGTKYQWDISKSDLSVKYLLLTSDDADYSQMAIRYRAYLLDNESIKKVNTENNNIPLSVTTIGAVNAKRAILGIPFDAPLSLTSYRQNIDLLNELSEKGVKNVVLNLEAWSNYGVNNTSFNKIETINQLGKKDDISELQKYIADNGHKLFFGTNFQYVGKETMTNSFNKNKYGARNLENVFAYHYEYELATKTKNLNMKKTIVSPRHYKDITQSFLNSFGEYKAGGIALNTWGTDLNGDYNENYNLDRTDVLDIIKNQIKDLSKNNSLSVNGGNFYALGGVEFVNESPLKSGSQYLTDESVPFYQIVLHGIIPYASEPLNMSADYETDALRLAETGTIPNFKWIYEDNMTLKNTGYNYYSVCYKSWIDRAAELYKGLNESLAGCQSAEIVKHEILPNGVRATTFSNNKTVYVNYNNESIFVSGTEIKGRSYLVK